MASCTPNIGDLFMEPYVEHKVNASRLNFGKSFSAPASFSGGR
eukprot:CAMPEP_0185168632 /NCGR_PEP_ID=MMETSP1139-20130426/16113_1 /TAXON_ID=298111 /ORGANISM="Pavlova sp., Strain CCMP459" /LENGTH=42 /DNA_ID= /DNA_START= /DNA_END= /DNA_ORIENTATION=